LAHEKGEVEVGVLTERQREVLFAARVLSEKLDDIWGHVTCRIPDNEGPSGFLLKHLRIPDKGVDPDEIMVFGYDGEHLFGKQGDPWEVPLYTAVFAARPDVHSVIHIHPPVATALSTAGETIHAVSHQGLDFGDGIPVFAGDIVDTDELGRTMADALGSGPALMLKGHGAVVVAPNVREATVLALYLERTAKQIVWASSVSRAEILPKRIRDHIIARRGSTHPELWRALEWAAERDR
jgi:ribulose-5-phosphate 4-epimerase/fuculose-1-phosphate aldolase